MALTRYGGLRHGEITCVRWCDIDWSTDDGRVTIWSPKTRHAGKPLRVIPLFPELGQALSEVFDAAPEGAVRVVNSYHEEANLRTQFDKIVARSGVKPWVKPFQNMRSTRVTELLDEGHPIKAVCQWIGHSEAVALRHYHQVTKKHYQAASRVSEKQNEATKKSSFWKSSVKSSVPSVVTGEHGGMFDLKMLLFPEVYALVAPSGPQQIAQQGLEGGVKNPGETAIQQKSLVKSSVTNRVKHQIGPQNIAELRQLIAVIPVERQRRIAEQIFGPSRHTTMASAPQGADHAE